MLQVKDMSLIPAWPGSLQYYQVRPWWPQTLLADQLMLPNYLIGESKNENLIWDSQFEVDTDINKNEMF